MNSSVFVFVFFSQLQYSIISGDSFGKMSINTVKMDQKFLGVVTVAKKLDRETKDGYILHVSW